MWPTSQKVNHRVKEAGLRARAEAVLAAGPDEVWRVLLVWEDQPAWMVDAVSVRVVSANREGVGVRIAARTRILGIPLLTDVLEVTEWEPPRRLALVRHGFARGRGTWDLEPLDGVTRFVWGEEIRLPIPMLGEMALLAYRPILQWLMRRSLRNLAARVR